MGDDSIGALIRAGVPIDRIRQMTDGTWAYAAPCPVEASGVGGYPKRVVRWTTAGPFTFDPRVPDPRPLRDDDEDD